MNKLKADCRALYAVLLTEECVHLNCPPSLNSGSLCRPCCPAVVTELEAELALCETMRRARRVLYDHSLFEVDYGRADSLITVEMVRRRH